MPTAKNRFLKSDFRCRPPKTDFRFLIYTPKNMYLKKNTPKKHGLKGKIYKIFRYPFKNTIHGIIYTKIDTFLDTQDIDYTSTFVRNINN